MKSPFPGMDPYIEASGLWEGFHTQFIQKIYEAVALALPPDYIAVPVVRGYVVLVQEEEKVTHPFKPDAAVLEPTNLRTGRRQAGAELVGPAEEEAVTIRPFIPEEFREQFVEIYLEKPERTLVTCIEVLSPSNKRPRTEGWDQYLRKRQALLLGQANFIEIDLLRGGQKLPMLDSWPKSPYSLLVSRRNRVPYARVWPAHFRRRLPPIPVPLVAPDPDLTLDLQPLIDGIYALSRYGQQIDYSRPLKPRLAPADAAWVREQLKNR